MPSAKQRANWARFAKMARARARASRAPRRRKASHSSPRKRRAPTKRTHMARRRRTTRKRSRGGRGKTVNIAAIAAAGVSIAVAVEPFVKAGLLEALKSKDPAAVIAALKTGGKECVSLANMIEMAAPGVILGVAKLITKMTGAKRPHIGKVYAY